MRPLPPPPPPPLRIDAGAAEWPAFSCPFTRVMAYYRSEVYSRYGLGKCSFGDWVKLCDGLHVPECPPAAGTMSDRDD
jgi:hypothetical protein